MSLPVTVTVQVQDWTQTWTTGEDPALAVVNAQGCVLDGLTAGWTMDGFPGQPSPTTCSFRLYVPAAATDRPTINQGTPVRVVLDPTGYTPGTGFDHVFEFLGRITDGDATPMRDGLAYSVVCADHTADLGEAKIGGSAWPQEPLVDRIGRLQSRLDSEGLELEWNPADPILTSSPAITAAARPAGSEAANVVLDQHLICLTKWSAPAIYSWKLAGTFDRRDAWDIPGFTDPREYPYRPYVVPAVSDTGDVTYRIVWQSPRVSNAAGVPLVLDWAGGVLGVTDNPTLPTTSRDGAWVPGCAVEKGITWRVDKEATPNRARASGWFYNFAEVDNFFVPGKKGAHRGRDMTIVTKQADLGVHYPDLDALNGPVEIQVDLPVISPSQDVDPVAAPHYVLWMLLGRHYDAEPQYTIGEVSIVPQEIDDPDRWPRLFQQRAQVATDYFGGAAGRFVFISDVKPEWHPYGKTYYWGSLVGATLELTGGRLRFGASLAHRLTGPNGPSRDSTQWWQAVSWTDVAALFPAVLVQDVDDSVSYADLTLTKASA